jgi:hypothetical protein
MCQHTDVPDAYLIDHTEGEYTIFYAVYTARVSDEDFDLLCVVSGDNEHADELLDHLRSNPEVRIISGPSIDFPDTLSETEAK